MNTINFQPLDFSRRLNYYDNEASNINNSITEGINGVVDNYDTWSKEKRKWDNMLEAQDYFKKLQDSSENDRQRYLSALAARKNLQGSIDSNNSDIESLNGQIEELAPKNNRVRNSMNRSGYTIPDGATPVEDENGISGYDYNGSHYSVDGINSGNYEEQGFKMNDGDWNGRSFNPYEEKYNGMQSSLAEKMSRGEMLNAQLADMDSRIEGYKRGYDQSAMFRDPRYQTAMMKAKSDMDPASMYNYMTQWNNEQAMRDSRLNNANALEAMENTKSIIMDKLGDVDLSEYGPNAEIAYEAMMNARDPQTFNSYYSALSNIMLSKNATDRIKTEQNNDKLDAAIEKIQDYENQGLAFGKSTDPNFIATLENMKSRLKENFGVDYDSSSNVGYNAGLVQRGVNKSNYDKKYNKAVSKIISKVPTFYSLNAATQRRILEKGLKDLGMKYREE